MAFRETEGLPKAELGLDTSKSSENIHLPEGMPAPFGSGFSSETTTTDQNEDQENRISGKAVAGIAVAGVLGKQIEDKTPMSRRKLLARMGKTAMVGLAAGAMFNRAEKVAGATNSGSEQREARYKNFAKARYFFQGKSQDRSAEFSPPPDDALVVDQLLEDLVSKLPPDVQINRADPQLAVDLYLSYKSTEGTESYGKSKFDKGTEQAIKYTDYGRIFAALARNSTIYKIVDSVNREAEYAHDQRVWRKQQDRYEEQALQGTARVEKWTVRADIGFQNTQGGWSNGAAVLEVSLIFFTRPDGTEEEYLYSGDLYPPSDPQPRVCMNGQGNYEMASYVPDGKGYKLPRPDLFEVAQASLQHLLGVKGRGAKMFFPAAVGKAFQTNKFRESR